MPEIAPNTARFCSFQSENFRDRVKISEAVLADDFTCIVNGEIMGKVSKEIIEKMPKAN